MKRLTILLIALAITITGNAQNRISGTVVAADTEHILDGATYRTIFENRAGQVNKEGKFSIFLTRPDTLVISCVGYDSQKLFVTPTNGIALEIKLQPGSILIDEVAVYTGYQKVAKERATGSFSHVDERTFNEQVGTTVLDRLPNIAGSISYDRRTTTSEFSIRGLSTIQGPKSPLIILDNFPYYGDLDNINPNEVESVTLLKDASASSIWGAKAGNGVIVITTKKGKFNQPLNIRFNSNFTVGEEPDLFRLKEIETADFIDVESFLYEQGLYNITNATTERRPVTPLISLLRQRDAGILSAESAQSQIDQWKQMDVRNEFARYFYQPSFNQQYSISLNSGSDKLAWKASLGYDRNRNELDAGYRRLNVNVSSIIKPTPKLEIATNLLITRSTSGNGNPAYGTISTSTGDIPRYLQFKDAGGNPLPMAKGYALEYLDTAGNGKLMDWKFYPSEDHKYNHMNTELVDWLMDISANYRLTDFLSANLLYRYERQQAETRSLYEVESYFARDLINNFSQVNTSTGTVEYAVPPGAILDNAYTLKPSHNVRAQLAADKNWAKHSLNALIGAEISQDNSSLNSSRLYGYNPDVLTFGTVDYVTRHLQYATGALGLIPYNASVTSITNRFISAYFNAAYHYDERYTLSLSGRQDGSNLFGVLPNNRFNPLWSIGFAWDVSKENFLPLDFFSLLKLRATYGYSGNTDQNRTAYPTISYRSNSRYTMTPYALMNSFANPNLKWEKVSMLNLALDFSTKNRRVSGNVEYYRKNAKDLFGRGQIDYTGGAGESIIQNVAAMKGQGIDVELNTVNLTGRLRWQSVFHGSFYSDEITEYYNPAVLGSDFVGKGTPRISGIVGRPVYAMYSYKFAGLDPQTGDPLGILDGSVSKDYANLNRVPLTELVYHGPALPTTFGNFRNIFTYRNVSFSIALTYKLGYYYRKESINYNSLFNQRQGHADFSRRWQKPGDEHHTSIPSMIYPANSSRDVFFTNSEATIIKGDHIRLQYISISYNISGPKKSAPYKSINLFANANNLGLIWRANRDDIDPDYRETSIPATRNMAIGVKVEF